MNIVCQKIIPYMFFNPEFRMALLHRELTEQGQEQPIIKYLEYDNKVLM